MKTLLILLMALAPLTARGEDLAGHYVLRGVMEVGSELWLKPDGSFEYMLAYGAADYSAKGTWRHEGDAVILNSAGKEEAPFRLLRSEAGKRGRIRVWVMGKNGRGVANIRVELKAGDQHFEATTDSDGAAVFPDAKGARAVSFEVRVYSVRAGPFEVSPSDRASARKGSAFPTFSTASSARWRLGSPIKQRVFTPPGGTNILPAKIALRSAMNPHEHITHSAEETMALGRKLAPTLKAARMVIRRGDLGTGKTTLVKGIAEGLRAASQDDVPSPTFTLIHEYRGPEVNQFHVDLYRIDTPRELDTLGLDELFAEPGNLVLAHPASPAPSRSALAIRRTEDVVFR